MKPFLLLCLCIAPVLGQNSERQFLRNPSLSGTQIVFEYANDLWIVARGGGTAVRLTSGTGREAGPHFSPDGKQIAFTGEYDGNTDVYVIPAAGGVPRRLTFHPGVDAAIGWTPDGSRVLFMSDRYNYADSNRLFSIAVNGTFPEALPLPTAEDGSYSPDGTHLAYSPVFQWQPAWKRYRGGQTTKIWIADLADSSVAAIPRENSNDFNPMWVGENIYFLSDRGGSVGVWGYNTGSKKVSELVKNEGLDIKSASATADAMVYEQFGALYLLDLKSGKSHAVEVQVAADLPDVRPRFEKMSVAKIENAAISPTGQRAVFETHGEILTIPAEKGDIRNLTASPSVADRDPAWSPDGKSIAYFSDESGEYALHIRNQNGLGEVTKIELGKPPSFFYSPVWSPDSKKIAYTDKRLNLWVVDLQKKTPVHVDTDRFDSPVFHMTPSWSPDSSWLAYSKQLKNHLHAVEVYSLATAKATQVTDGMSDALSPDFDKSGKYIYFTASTTSALNGGWIDMTSIERPLTSAVYVMVLRKDLPSPLEPQSDDEKSDAAEAKPADKEKEKDKDKDKDKGKDKDEKKAPAETRIDFDGISQRILAAPVPQRNYAGLIAGKEGMLFLVEQAAVPDPQAPAPLLTVQKYDFKTRKEEPVVAGVANFQLSQDGEKALIKQGEQWLIVKASEAPKPGEGVLKLADMEVYVDPRAEWKQMYHEVWRIERDFFYDPHFHGLDLKAAESFYARYVAGVATRSDLTYLFNEMLGNLTVGHMFVRGGTQPEVRKIKVGLLGADYSVENGRYRFAKVFDGENWNPELQAPLTQPGVNVKAGEYLLSVRGRDVRAADNLYSLFAETAGKQVVLRVGASADGTAARDVTVVPVESEAGLRHLAWVEGNRRTVDRLTNGRIAYLHMPDTALGGFTSFNRYFFAQIGKSGVIVDERYNHGGDIADYVIEYLSRRPLAKVATREGEDIMDPSQAIFGPKVMMINQFAGSGGDAMPWYFRQAGLGPLVGMKTWGGLVGIGGYPPLIDGGSVTAPRWAFYGLNNEWDVENHGISPDVEVELDPKLAREGRDSQLEKAVQVELEQLKNNPPKTYEKPAYPNYHQHFPTGGSE